MTMSVSLWYMGFRLHNSTVLAIFLRTYNHSKNVLPDCWLQGSLVKKKRRGGGGGGGGLKQDGYGR